jgi:hypothetical protein
MDTVQLVLLERTGMTAGSEGNDAAERTPHV